MLSRKDYSCNLLLGCRQSLIMYDKIVKKLSSITVQRLSYSRLILIYRNLGISNDSSHTVNSVVVQLKASKNSLCLIWLKRVKKCRIS